MHTGRPASPATAAPATRTCFITPLQPHLLLRCAQPAVRGVHVLAQLVQHLALAGQLLVDGQPHTAQPRDSSLDVLQLRVLVPAGRKQQRQQQCVSTIIFDCSSQCITRQPRCPPAVRPGSCRNTQYGPEENMPALLAAAARHSTVASMSSSSCASWCMQQVHNLTRHAPKQYSISNTSSSNMRQYRNPPKAHSRWACAYTPSNKEADQWTPAAQPNHCCLQQYQPAQHTPSSRARRLLT